MENESGKSGIFSLEPQDIEWLRRYCWNRGVNTADRNFITEMCCRLLSQPEVLLMLQGATSFVARRQFLLHAAFAVVSTLNDLQQLRPWLRRYASRRVSDNEKAEDLTQQILLKCTYDLPLYCIPGSLNSASEETRRRRMILMLRNAIIDDYRKVKPQELSLDSPISQNGLTFAQILASPDATPSEVADVHAIEREIENFLKEVQQSPRSLGFTARNTAVLQLYFIDHLTYDEIHEVTGMSIGTISVVIQNARRQLAQRLELPLAGSTSKTKRRKALS